MYLKEEVFDRLVKYKKVIVTGGAGFIGGALIRRLLQETNLQIYNLDKITYASNEISIKNTLLKIRNNAYNRYKLLKVDLNDEKSVNNIITNVKPDLVIHLAAESHVDRSIKGPRVFLESNVIGTYNLLEACRKFYLRTTKEKQKLFRFHHVSTDEVFGSLGIEGRFSENSQYSPNSPYSASKAASDHLVNAWYHTYGMPVVITNCSNNFGPWQYPEKLIPLSVINGFLGKPITLYGDGLNIRDWLFVEDHIDALLSVAMLGELGNKYCIGGSSELSNKEVLNLVCSELDKLVPKSIVHSSLITYVEDRKGHDFRYAINSEKIMKKLGWSPSFTFEESLSKTITWYVNNIEWAIKTTKKSR